MESTDHVETKTVKLHGDVDTHYAPEVRAILLEAIGGAGDGPPLLLVTDLSEVTGIDSTGWGVLISTATRLANRGGSLRLAAATDRVRRMHGVMRLAQARNGSPGLPLYDSVAQAAGAAERRG